MERRNYQFKHHTEDYSELTKDVIMSISGSGDLPEVEFVEYVLNELTNIEKSRFESDTDKMDAAEELYCFLASQSDFSVGLVYSHLFFAAGYYTGKGAETMAYNVMHYIEIVMKYLKE